MSFNNALITRAISARNSKIFFLNTIRVRYIGYSNYPAWQAQKMLDIQVKNRQSKFISAQMYYSLLGRDLEHEVVPFLEHNGLALIVWSPLASGFLTGKYTRENPVPRDSRRAKTDFPPFDIERG